MAAVNNGEVDGALIYHYYYFGDQAKTKENSDNVALHYFKNQDPGAFVSISGGGVLASSKHKDQALEVPQVGRRRGRPGGAARRHFLRIRHRRRRRRPIRRCVPLAELEAPKVDPSQLDNAKVTDLMTAAGLL